MGYFFRRSAHQARQASHLGNSALRKDYASLGGQVDLHFSILHRYDMTLSAGYAVGYQGSQRAGSEWMISLKIM